MFVYILIIEDDSTKKIVSESGEGSKEKVL